MSDLSECSQRRVVGICGNLQRPSKSRALVTVMVESIAMRYGVATEIVDLLDAMPELGTTVGRQQCPGKVSRILDLIEGADVLVVGTPVYKGSYTGLFKHLFDLVEPERLAGTPVVLTAAGGGDRHALVVEHQLRPLFGFFAASTIATSVYASEKDFVEGRLSADTVMKRINCAVVDLAPWLANTSKISDRTFERRAASPI